jgi:hypothetical protein
MDRIEASLREQLEVKQSQISHLEADRWHLAQKVKELKAIVDTLPKTIDNVPVTLGMTLWMPDRDRVYSCKVNFMNAKYVNHPWLYGYSTRSAAEAAMKKEEA